MERPETPFDSAPDAAEQPAIAAPEIESDSASRPAVRRTARALRRDSLQTDPGQGIGREDELIERYGVSRPTLRQAAALVGLEHLVRVRRGVGGGYFADRPDASTVAQVAAVMLRIRAVKLAKMLEAIEPIRVDMI